MKYDYTVYIGRFQPFHRGHIKACKQAFELGKHLIILVGSAFASPSPRNPFSFEYRRDMIAANLHEAGYHNFTILPLRDYYYSDSAWVSQVMYSVSNLVGAEKKITLLGYEKDSSSYYLRLFPQWESSEIDSKFRIDATAVREQYFAKETYAKVRHPWQSMLTDTTASLLHQFKSTNEYTWLFNECKAVKTFKDDWKDSPHPPMFVTMDAIVTYGGYIGMIRRGGDVGKGLLALPGGFRDVKKQERLVDGCIRELKEETNIQNQKPGGGKGYDSIPPGKLKSMIVDQKYFDHPLRDPRGSFLTHVFHFKFDGMGMPKLEPGDDADEAFMMPINELRSEECFGDHYQIIKSFGLIGDW